VPRAGPRIPIAVLVIAALAACQSAPPASGGPGAAAIASRITTDGLGSTLDALARIASEHGGTRRTGSPGEAATMDFLEGALRDAGYQVREDRFDSPVFTDGTTDQLVVLGSGGPTFEAGADFGPLMFSPAGTVEGPVVSLDWNPKANAPDGLGCSAADFVNVTAGAIVLARPAGCLRRAVVINAEAAGAVGLVAAIPWAAPGEVRRSTLVVPDRMDIPAMGADGAVGDALDAVARVGGHVRLVTSGTTETRSLRSVLAELPGADPSRVVMVGAHVDSSMDGPGINDDGSGVATVLALAKAMAGTTPPVTIRFAFWAAEESGLHGSTHYVVGLSAAGGGRVVAYLNADMLGSPNGFRGVYDDAQAAPGSSAIRDRFEADLTAQGLVWKTLDLFGSADHAPFEQAGIPTGGLFSGASELITADDAATFGRKAGEYADSCYHLACDGRTNVDADLLLELARSLVRVTLEVAASPPG
jgi:peptidase M28-like protein/PA domain-containing protein